MGDLVLGIILLIAVLNGYHRGVIKILGSWGGTVIGVFLARRITPYALPWIEEQFNWTVEGAVTDAVGNDALAAFFISETSLGRVVELVIFVFLVVLITWVIKMFVNATGSVVNGTPILGKVSRILGAILEVCLYSMIIYCLYVWIIPWLVSIIPALSVVNSIFDTSTFVLPIIISIGNMIWFSMTSLLAGYGVNL